MRQLDQYIKISIIDNFSNIKEFNVDGLKSAKIELCRSEKSKKEEVCTHVINFHELSQRELSHSILQHVDDTVDVKIYFLTDDKTTHLSPQMSVNFVRFLKNYKPWSEQYCCFNFAVEMVYGREAVIQRNGLAMSKIKVNHSDGLNAGKIIGLSKPRAWWDFTQHTGHVAVSIGNDTYLSLSTDEGIAVTSLEHLKKAMHLPISFVFFDAAQGIDLLSAQGQIAPESIFHTAEKLYAEISRSASIDVPMSDITSEVLIAHFGKNRTHKITPVHPLTCAEISENGFHPFARGEAGSTRTTTTTSFSSARGNTSMRPLTDSDIKNLPRFKNNGITALANHGVAVTINLDTVKGMQKSDILNFIVTENNQFIAGPAAIKNPTTGLSRIQNHPHLAGFGSVITAGSIRFENGVCIVKNNSGHYEPQGPHQEALIRQHLSEMGITNVAFSYESNSDRPIDFANPPKNMIHPDIPSQPEDKNIFTQFFTSVCSDLKSMCDNPFLPKNDYEKAKIKEVFRAHMQAAGPTFHLHAPHTSQNKGLSQLTHYLTSPKHFAEHAKLISQKTLAFIRSDHPDAAALTEQTLCRFQNEYLEKIQRYSETSPEKTLDYTTELLDKENIPENVRSIYYQQCLSALPIKDDLSIDLSQIKKNHLEVKTQLQHLEKQYAHLQKNADQHHKQTSESLHKIKEAVNGNTAAIHDLKVGQQQIVDYFNAQTIEAEKVLKAQQKEQQHQQSIEGYQKFGQFLGMMGDATDVSILKDAGTVCMAGVMAYQAYTGFVALSTAATVAAQQATAAALATGATSFGAALGPIAMAGMAALMVVSMFFKKESGAQSNEAHQQIMRALQQMLHQIMSKLDLIQKQMHERFDRVDKRLDQIVELIYTGFDQVLLETKKIVGLHLQGLYAGEKLAAKVDAVASDMHASFEAIQDTLIKPIISGILKPSSVDYLENLSISEFSTRKERLFFFLTATSCSAAANGFHRIDDAGEVSIRHDAIAKTLRDQSIPKLSHLLGLLAGLANHHVGTTAIAAHPESLLNPTQWRPALIAYEKLLTECNPALGLDKASHSAEINELSDRLKQLQIFLQNVSINNPLFEALVKNYHDALSNIEKLIVGHFENQEMAYYKKACIPVQPGEHLLRLDETFDDAQKRQKSEEFLRLCQDSPVRFSAKTPAENLNPGEHVEEYLFHADLKRPNGTQFDSVHEGRYKYGNDDYTLVLVTSFPEFMEPKKIYARLKPTTIEYITNGLGKKEVIDRATLSHIYPVSPYDLAAVREDILFHAAIINKDNSVHTLIDWDPAKLAFAHFKNHFSTFVKLSLSSSVLYKNYAPQLALLMKLNQLTLSKKYNADITDTGDGSGNDSQGYFTRVVNCTYSYALSRTHGSQLGLLEGSKNTQIRNYWTFFTPESVSYSHSEDLALYLGSFGVVSGADNWGVPSLNALPYGFIEKETQKIIELMHPYRLQALDELQTDVRFTQALEKLESTALQLCAFMNLLQIDPSVYQAKMVRASHVLSLLSESKMASNPNGSIEKIKSLLSRLREKSLKKEDVLALTRTVNIELNSLHVWSQESIDDLGKLVLKVNAWTDAPTQKTKEEADYQRGLEIGNAFSLSAISAALLQAGFPDAARIVLGNQSASVLIVDEKELSASEKRGFLQAISAKVIEVVPLLANTGQVPALVWLTTIFHQQNTKLLKSSDDVTSGQEQTGLNRNRFLGGATTSGVVTTLPKQENANQASLGSV